MEESVVARDLATVIAQEIAAQLGVHRSVEDMPSLIADAILDIFQVQPRREVEFRLPALTCPDPMRVSLS